MDVSIVIPVYNEESRIGSTLEKIYTYFKNKNFNFEIIVVDDGSRDRTEKIVRQFSELHPEVSLIKHSQNKGKGAAVRTGVLASKGKLILFTDADLSTPIEEFGKLKQAIEDGYDIAIGSRALHDSIILIRQPRVRESLGKIFNLTIRLIFRLSPRDTQCGFKLFRGFVGKDIFSKSKISGFVFDVESILWAKKLDYKVKEVAVRWGNSEKTSISLFFTSPQILKEILQLYIQNKRVINRDVK